MTERLQTGAVAHALIAEGATNVWGDAMRGIHEDRNHAVGALVVHTSIIRDGIGQPMTENPNYGKLRSAGIVVSSLDRHDDGSGSLPVYTPDDLDRLNTFVRGKKVVTTLEEYPLGALGKLDSKDLPPIVANLYRSGAFKPELHIRNLLEGFRKGTIAHATVDAYASKAAYAERGVSPDDITVIPNGIDTERFAPSPEKRAKVRKELNMPDGAPGVLFIGRDSPEKNVPLFLESARIYLEKTPDAHAIMSGAGLNLDNPNIAALVKKYFGNEEVLKSRLHLLGIRSDMDALYNAADVLAITSATESRPLCISEAQASGLGVTVSTDVGDAPVMIGKHGFITDNNPEEIAARWAEAYAKRHEIGFPLDRREELGTRPMIAQYDRVLRDTVS